MSLTTKKPQTVMAMRHSGTHLILPLVQQLTGKTIFRPKGQYALNCTPNGPVIVFLRDPRDRMVSMFRWKTHSGFDDERLAEFMLHTKADATMNALEFASKWAKRWMHHEGALYVRFEDLKDRATAIPSIQKIKEHLNGSGDPEAAYDAVYGAGTYTGRHSNWREWFGPISMKTWKRNGGPELVQKMGYE